MFGKTKTSVLNSVADVGRTMGES